MKNNTKKAYTFRLDINLMNKLKDISNNRTAGVTDAIKTYCENTDNESTEEYDSKIVTILNNQIEDLKNDKTYLQSQVNALMIAKTPLLQRVLGKIRS